MSKPLPNNPYHTSHDYLELYNLVKQGNAIVGFVDYGESKLRDVVKIVQHRYDDGFSIGVRGIEYHGTFNDSEPDFISACQELNLEWISL